MKIFGGTLSLSHRLKDQVILKIGGSPGTSSRYPALEGIKANMRTRGSSASSYLCFLKGERCFVLKKKHRQVFLKKQLS